MSVKWTSRIWAMDDPRLRLGTLLVLLTLADHADDEGVCWPSMDRIAMNARLTTRQARRVVGSLIEWGYVSTTTRSGGRGRASSYMLHIPEKADNLSGYAPEKEDISCISPKADNMSGYLPQKADNLSGYVAENPDIYDNADVEKADICDINPDICDGKADICDQKADIAPHTREEPSLEPSSDPSPEPSVCFVGGEPPTHTGHSAGYSAEQADAWTTWLRALAWVCYGHQDLNALTQAQFGALTAEAKRMFADGFRPDDLRTWLDEEWKPQWAGQYARSRTYPRPRPEQVRAGIPAVHARTAALVWDVLPVKHEQAKRHAEAAPAASLDATWRAVLMETLAAYPQESDARRWLEGSRLEEADPVDDVPRYRVQLATPDGASWVRDRLSVPMRRSLKSLLGKAVLVEVVAPEPVAMSVGLAVAA